MFVLFSTCIVGVKSQRNATARVLLIDALMHWPIGHYQAYTNPIATVITSDVKELRK